MPKIQAFRGLRYDLGHVGSLSDVIAPPYDVIDNELQTELYEKHPANVVRLILNRDEPGDDDTSNRYTRASRFLRNWKNEGVLFTESNPSIYVYHQEFTEAGVSYTRRGFMARIRLERFGEGDIHPHEETHGGAKADRLKLWKSCRTNLSQIFGVYPDIENEAQNHLEKAILGVTPLVATDHLGIKHSIWPVSDVEIITAVQGAMGEKPVYIADGHHRYETACNYRDELAAADPNFSEEHPANYVLMMCVSMDDPGMIVLPTHRLFREMPQMTATQLIEKLGDCFSTEAVGTGPEKAEELWELVELEDEQSTLCLYTAEDQQWTMVRITAAGRAKMAAVAPDQSDDWQSLGVSILHRLIIGTLLEQPAAATPKYVRKITEVSEGLLNGDDTGRDLTGQIASGGRFELGAIVMPATLEHIRAISNHGERMPAKSTYFYPKLLSGLVLNPLE